ncbi:MAG: transketolase [Clostridia bacterium]|nr:transketolase [Clostridia bacterium]
MESFIFLLQSLLFCGILCIIEQYPRSFREDNKEKRSMNTESMALEMRKLILTSLYHAKSGHPGGSLSITDILAVLYNEEMNLDPADPKKADRDRFVMSKGHAAPALYAALAVKGYFPKEDMVTLRKIDSHLEGHPSMKSTPGVDMSTGSLGQGISAACGMALSAKLTHRDYRVYAALGDGEIEEGQVWEAMMFAAHYKLDNLCVFVDLNGLQIDGPTAEVMGSDPVPDKMRAFGLEVIEIDGHNYDEIRAALKKARETKGKPTCIVAHTVKGKGVSYMENKCDWHGAAPKLEEYEIAMKELEQHG